MFRFFDFFTEKIVSFFEPLVFRSHPGFQQIFEALDDEEFFVIEGSGVAGVRESRLPGDLPPISLRDSLHRHHSCDHIHTVEHEV